MTDFRKKYPLSLLEVVNTPIIFHDNTPALLGLPWPSLAGIRDMAEYAGFSYSALRTALSRAKARGELESFAGNDRVTRYRMAQSMINIGHAVTRRDKKLEGFILAVFSFKKDDMEKRQNVRDTLKYYGFKKLAQNTYINGRIETSGLVKAMKEFGVEKNLYLFHSPDISDPALIDRIKDVFDIRGRLKEMEALRRDLMGFLNESALGEDELARRIFYCGPVFYTKCMVEEPPIPAKFLPAEYPVVEIQKYFRTFSKKHGAAVLKYYLKINQ